MNDTTYVRCLAKIVFFFFFSLKFFLFTPVFDRLWQKARGCYASIRNKSKLRKKLHKDFFQKK